MNGVSVIRTLERQWRGIGKLPIFPNGMAQIGENNMSILNCFPNAVFHYPPFQINRLSGGRRSSIPVTSLRTHRNSCQFSQARLRDALDAPSFVIILGVLGKLSDMRLCVQKSHSRPRAIRASTSANGDLGVQIKYETLRYSTVADAALDHVAVSERLRAAKSKNKSDRVGGLANSPSPSLRGPSISAKNRIEFRF